MSAVKIAAFFATKADRDTAYAALKPLFVGDDHGVSGDTLDAMTGTTPPWQLWATYEGDSALVKTAVDGVTKQSAAVVSDGVKL